MGVKVTFGEEELIISDDDAFYIKGIYFRDYTSPPAYIPIGVLNGNDVDIEIQVEKRPENDFDFLQAVAAAEALEEAEKKKREEEKQARQEKKATPPVGESGGDELNESEDTSVHSGSDGGDSTGDSFQLEEGEEGEEGETTPPVVEEEGGLEDASTTNE